MVLITSSITMGFDKCPFISGIITSIRMISNVPCHVVVIQRSQAIVIFRLVQKNIRSDNAFSVQLLFDDPKTPPLNILRFFQCLVNIPGTNNIGTVCIKIGQCSVLLDNVGRRLAAVGRGGIILFHGLNILQQHDMGKADMILPHRDGGIQFL